MKPARRAVRKQDIKVGNLRVVAQMEQALADEASKADRNPRLPRVTEITMVNKDGKQGFGSQERRPEIAALSGGANKLADAFAPLQKRLYAA
jgi:hypothetical protein